MFLSFFQQGKTASYQCLPLLHQKLHTNIDLVIIVVVSPLKALMKDQISCIVAKYLLLFCSLPNLILQVSALSSKGLTACQTDDLVKEGVCNGDYHVYFTSEILLSSKKWSGLLVGYLYSSRLLFFL